MKFYSISSKKITHNNPIFQKNENNWRVFGYDESGKKDREYIRNWQEEYYRPYQSIYENEKIKCEYDLKLLLNQFNRKSFFINNNLMAKIGLANLELLENSNSYRGAMIRGYEFKKLIQLKDAGIKRVVSLMKDPELENNCKKLGLEYLYYEIDFKDACFENRQDIENKARTFWQILCKKDNNVLESYVQKDVEDWMIKIREPIEKNIKFLNYMQKDNVYLGCACGTYRTDLAVLLNSLFNPKANCDCNFYINKENLKLIENLFYNLTAQDKLKLGWTKDFEKNFISNFNKLKLKY